MILHALYDYYQRKAADPESALAPEGFERKEIPFFIVLDADGGFVQFDDTREGDGKKKRARAVLVPQGVKKTSGVAANLLWDNAEYVLGVDAPEKSGKAAEKHQSFVQRLREVFGEAPIDAGLRAVLRFLAVPDGGRMEADPLWPEISRNNPYLTFRLAGESVAVCERPDVVHAITSYLAGAGGGTARCLITGANDTVERLHPPIKGVRGAQTSGANIVSFNLSAFNSWGKEQGTNAPVGKKAAFAYTTALNHLLSMDSRQRMQVGDASTVFWAEKDTFLENDFDAFFGESPKDDPDRHAQAVKRIYESVRSGASHLDEADGARFFVLGLSPNAARIAVRFWHVATVRELAGTLRRHFDDTRIDHAPFEPDSLPLVRLIAATALQGKYDNIPPSLAGETMKSVLAGTPYPHTLMQAAINRIRAEKGTVTYPRAALVKAWLNRYTRQSELNEKEMTVPLDETNINTGYRLGRLFSVLEKAQEEASHGINATIRDRFYGAASATPVTVFPNLMKLKNHHLAKLENRGRVVNLERMIGGIVEEIHEFPAHLSLADQGRFAIGYYHQRQAFYKSNQGE